MKNNPEGIGGLMEENERIGEVTIPANLYNKFDKGEPIVITVSKREVKIGDMVKWEYIGMEEGEAEVEKVGGAEDDSMIVLKIRKS